MLRKTTTDDGSTSDSREVLMTTACHVVGAILLGQLWPQASACTQDGTGADASEEHSADHWNLGGGFDLTPDVDGDGLSDLVVIGQRSRPAGEDWSHSWELLSVSGRDGSVFWRLARTEFETLLPGHAELTPAYVQSWADWDTDGTADVLLVVRVSKSWIEGPWEVLILSGETGKLIANPKIPSDALPNVVLGGPAWTTREPEEVGGGLVLERQRRSRDGGAWERYSKAEGLDWGRLRIWSFGPGGSKLESEVDAPTGEVFCSSPNWIEGLPGHSTWGFVCLSRVPGQEEASLRSFRVSHREGGLLEWTMLNPPELKLATNAYIEALDPGDVNADGVLDIAVASSYFLLPGQERRVVILDGASGAVLVEFVDHGPGAESFGCDIENWKVCGFASSLAVLGDLDRDGANELVIGSSEAFGGSGGVVVLNPRTKEVLGLVQGGFDTYKLGTMLDAGFDFNADGVPDFVASEQASMYAKAGKPKFQICSGLSFETIRLLPD